MPVEVVWSNLAREELLNIYVAIALENPSAAERIYDRIERRAQQLADHPKIGPRRPDIRPAARMLVETPYLILYEAIPDTDDEPVMMVEVVNVVDGRRNLVGMF